MFFFFRQLLIWVVCYLWEKFSCLQFEILSLLLLHIHHNYSNVSFPLCSFFVTSDFFAAFLHYFILSAKRLSSLSAVTTHHWISYANQDWTCCSDTMPIPPWNEEDTVCYKAQSKQVSKNVQPNCSIKAVIYY